MEGCTLNSAGVWWGYVAMNHTVLGHEMGTGHERVPWLRQERKTLAGMVRMFYAFLQLAVLGWGWAGLPNLVRK